MEIIPYNEEPTDLVAGAQPTLEEMRENLLLGITTSVRQASGIKDPAEFELTWGTRMRHLKLVVDHVITLAIQQK